MMARLEEICAINMGQSPDSSTYNEDGNGLPFFQGNADFGEIYPAVRMWCSEPTKIAREKDILISVRAPIGALNIANCECCIGRGLAALTVNEDICAQEYLWHALSGKVDELNSKGTGSTFKAINKKTLSETEIPLPPIDEQRKIAAILDKVSDLIAKRQQQLDKLDEMVKARFVEMFGDPQNNEKNWKMRTFKEICTVRQGLQIPISKRLTHFEENCYEYITVAYLHGAKDKEYIKNPKSTVICTKDDVLMTRTGNSGMVITNVAGVFHNNFFLIDFDRDKYIKEFLVEYLNLDLIQTELKKRAGTSTIPDLNHSEFYKIAIYEPPMDLQNQFAAFVNQTEKSKTTVSHSLEKLETLKKALMQEYFR
jgi:type I restriction enzyme S subunit